MMQFPVHRPLSWPIKDRFFAPDIALIRHDDAGLCFDASETRYATRPQKEIDAAFSDLTAELLLVLDRLLGWEVAPQICAAA
jgi:hypothetical protein